MDIIGQREKDTEGERKMAEAPKIELFVKVRPTINVMCCVPVFQTYCLSLSKCICHA